ncbi:MAG: sulfatase-like hydrolase/transferase [Elusimicrobiaceae bacterium]|nr:sulfatase-like hydrolase/transferase [Elusimicrobiaceae bacterium]
MKRYPLFTFSAFHGVIWGIISLLFFAVNGFFTDGFGLLFTVSFIIGHAFFFAWLLGLLCRPFKKTGARGLAIAAVSLASLFTAVLAVDLLVFSQYRFHIGLFMLGLFFGPAGREIFVFPVTMWLLVALCGLIIVALETGLWVLANKAALRKKWLISLLAAWGVCFLVYNGLYAWGQFRLVPSIMAQRKVLPFSFPFSANRRLEALGFRPAKNPYFIPNRGKLNYPAAPLNCPAVKQPKNVLVLLIDSWRADAFTESIMPRLSSWSKLPGMHRFTNHISSGNSTPAGVFPLFYGLPSSYWDDVTNLHISPVLLSHAWQQGYEPAIFASSKLTSPAFYRNVFVSVPDLRIGSEGSSCWERDENAVQDFEKFLAKRTGEKPFFGFIFLDAPHGYSYPEQDTVFTPAQPPNYILLNNKTDPTPYFNQYKNAVHFSDRMVDDVLNALKKKGLLENTFIIITADHGQEFNDSHRNFWGHNGNFTDWQTKVPLLVYDGKNENVLNDYRTTHYDIAPTLLQEVFHCTNAPGDYSLGYNLFDPTPRAFSVFAGHTEKAIRVGDDILALDNFGGVEQYNGLYDPVSQPLPADLVKEGLKSFRRFYK